MKNWEQWEETGIFYTGIRIFALYEFGIVLYNK